MMGTRRGSEERTGRRKSLATIGMRGSAAKRKRIVEDSMSATNVERQDTEERNVGKSEHVL
jgi:hypothetical protein